MGGDKGIIDSVTPVLDTFTNRLIHVGRLDQGMHLSLYIIWLRIQYFLRLLKGSLVRKKLGIDPKTVIDVFNSGNARSYISQSRFQIIYYQKNGTLDRVFLTSTRI